MTKTKTKKKTNKIKKSKNQKNLKHQVQELQDHQIQVEIAKEMQQVLAKRMDYASPETKVVSILFFYIFTSFFYFFCIGKTQTGVRCNRK
jgi:hypothetical protein